VRTDQAPAADLGRHGEAPVVLGIGLVVAGLLAVGVLGLGLAWDGAWYVLRATDTGSPMFLHGRLVHVIPQAPMVVLRGFVEDPMLLGAVFGIGYALIPALALLASWLIVRRTRPELIIWPLMSIGLVSLPGAALLQSEALHVASLVWPCLLAVATGQTRRHVWIVVTAAGAMAIAHPLAVPLFAVLAGVAVANREGGSRGERGIVASAFALLTILVAARYLLGATPYEAEAISIERLGWQFRASVAGAPLVVIGAVYAIGMLIVLRRMVPTRLALIASLAAVTAGGVAMAAWAASGVSWERALAYRGWVVILVAPLILGAAVSALRGPDHRPSLRRVLAPAIGTVTLVVLLVQGGTWQGTLRRLAADLDASPPGCVDVATLPWVATTPLDHWGLTSLSLVVEGRAPGRMIAHGAACDDLDTVGGLPVKILDGVVADRRPGDGWYDLAALLAAMGE
jgi:hypothetical protein